MTLYRTLIENSYRLPSPRIGGCEARIDGISFSFSLLDLPRVRQFTAHLLSVPFEYQATKFGSRWYENYSIGVGAYLHWQHRDGYPLGLCELKGEYFSFLDVHGQKSLVDFIHSIGAKPSVIALDVDDYDRVRAYSPSWFKAEWESKRCKGFKTWDSHHSFRPARKELGYGDTISFGRRGSKGGQKFFSCYDKNVESDGALNCYRYELTLYKHKAFDAVKLLADASSENWHSLISSIIQGEIKFENFKITEKSIKFPSKKPKNCLYAKARWIHRQVPLVYAALNQAYLDAGYSSSLHQTLIHRGENNPKYSNLVAAFRNFLSIDDLLAGPQDSPMG